MSESQEPKKNSISRSEYFENLRDDKDVLWDYLKENLPPGAIFHAGQIPLWQELGEEPARNKIRDILWRLVYRDYIDLHDGTEYPILFRRKGAPYVKRKKHD